MFQNIVYYPHALRLYSERALADTTAETHASVKREHHIEDFRNASAADVHSGLRGAAGIAGRCAVERRRSSADFSRGQQALQDGKLDEAEEDLREVLQIDPQSGAAYTNLGVVYMRRKQWARARGRA